MRMSCKDPWITPSSKGNRKMKLTSATIPCFGCPTPYAAFIKANCCFASWAALTMSPNGRYLPFAFFTLLELRHLTYPTNRSFVIFHSAWKPMYIATSLNKNMCVLRSAFNGLPISRGVLNSTQSRLALIQLMSMFFTSSRS